ncbi:YjbQ family protein [Kribbella speibonae]|uniref:YjbQ family protein n=1 Tax=Kribbella speibonae TaxID=1572660 RepID=A0A4R0J0V0_9ACTN|nr:YjbQ family protein [Kribbella speibonae]TCC26533.1 YjbQ family protein [Kribbella speibonae]TCC38634.1 YjbQ family protein [Kribbella speibonae]
MDSIVLDVNTGAREVVLDLTSRCEQFVSGRGDGLLHVFVPHATAGVAILETGAGSDLDLLAVLEDLLPRDFEWRHRHGSPGHGRDHVLPALIPPYATVPVLAGRLTLGTWQSICLVDTNRDNPDRHVRLSFLAG